MRDLWGDLGVCVYEIWKSICLFDYAHLSEGAVNAGDYLVISLEKLLFLKALGMEVEKYHKDLELIAKKVRNDKWMQLPKERQAYYLESETLAKVCEPRSPEPAQG